MHKHLFTKGLIALSLLTACDLIPAGILPGASPQPSAVPTASPDSGAVLHPSASPEPTATPSSSASPGLTEAGLLLYLDMETSPIGYLYQGAAVEEKGVSASVEGKQGASWRFDGQGSFLKIPLDINPDQYPRLTFAAWARYEGPAESGGPFQVISHDDGGYDRSLGIDSRGADGVGWSSFAGSAAVLGSVPVQNGQWVFLASVYDQQAKTVTLYVNGVRKVAENAELGKGHPFLYIGSNPSHGEHFTGLIDEVRVYGRALSASEIEALQGAAPLAASPQPSPLASQEPVKFFDNGNILAVLNGAPCAPVVTTTRAYLLTEINNYHWNDAKGQAPPGQIGLRSSTGVIYGPWDVSTRPGQGGVPNAYWYAQPQIVLPAGSYTVTDSHPESWSYNAASSCSMSWLTGIPQ
ncbi:hypothetical protein COW36_07245 [bacterium (Candidatus Blackallbacteria) CG17_big_fil_post_rev_8_21_14_2_50_48_46]|uniref:LamG-like jellyroll fold domain-containing protein n=1 Tax=bacterium (Candidatus Blackallbacteria) CG17_big_fil_post_rev_8_21_14_2_50_48_46 TaxID=2014261 RepID=A0A2M7G783_9BACT|nr:MAG: hypothetical protein COW64_06755 [bacterium (Candidatus Blackallbacteria) CG18_big_fil_WC_8_21_14_2_50_49_26]PIW17857.1 MAG: hypothetical protein COW36_07245 [bacterium (Candidatus Blackallbacteria) CG17_big_fil_post_rev_8_21_14_2_50_48_46]PIW48533.1 MAG: hypothetical protein COW20_09200 [bacterium (Candidatus Blackallbacteria) CG13_big_fil_rev_8_21_14_2_50_49_14]